MKTYAAILLFAAIIGAGIFAFGHAIDAQTDPAIPACEQAIADGFYYAEIFGQCVDDYHSVDDG